MSRRLFVALRPPLPVRTALQAAMGGIEAARWQNDNQLHLTLAFLGGLDRHGIDAATDALASVCQPPFDVRLDALGSFAAGRADRVAVLWAMVVDACEEASARRGNGPLSHLAGSVRQALRGAGLAIEERRFFPHITLARFPRAGAPRDSLRRWLSDARVPPLVFPVGEFHLVESRMGVGGSHYQPLASYALAGG